MVFHTVPKAVLIPLVSIYGSVFKKECLICRKLAKYQAKWLADTKEKENRNGVMSEPSFTGESSTDGSTTVGAQEQKQWSGDRHPCVSGDFTTAISYFQYDERAKL